jgi:hypothetical protein
VVLTPGQVQARPGEKAGRRRRYGGGCAQPCPEAWVELRTPHKAEHHAERNGGSERAADNYQQ